MAHSSQLKVCGLIVALLLFGACEEKSPPPPLSVSVEVKDIDYLGADEIAVDITLHNETINPILWDNRVYSSDGTTITDGLLMPVSCFYLILSSSTGEEKTVGIEWRKPESWRRDTIIMHSRFLVEVQDIDPNGIYTFPASVFDQKEYFNKNSWFIRGVFRGRIALLSRHLKKSNVIGGSDYKNSIFGLSSGMNPLKESVYEDLEFSKVKIESPETPFRSSDEPISSP